MPDTGFSDTVIEARELTRRYGDRVAVDRVSFAIPRGEVFGFLGPNGAGKSTTTRMLTGFVRPTAGQALIAGIDVALQPSRARRHMGVVPEEASVYAELTVRQNVLLMGELHVMPKGERMARTEELLVQFELVERANDRGRDLSKGLRQRLMLCMALVSEPQVLFLDEPTTGLDVASTHLIRDVIVRLNRERGMTVFLTTHNMEEAEQLCHRVAIINHGRLAAIDTPTGLRERVTSLRSVRVEFEQRGVRPEQILPTEHGRVTESANGFRVFDARPGRLAQTIAARALHDGIAIESIETLAPSLEDVFLSLTAEIPREPQ